MKTCLYEDLARCLEVEEALEMLNDPYAENELKRLIQSRYGKLAEFQLINFSASDLAHGFI